MQQKQGIFHVLELLHQRTFLVQILLIFLSDKTGQEINPDRPTMLISNPEVVKALKENQQGESGQQRGEPMQQLRSSPPRLYFPLFED